MSNVNSRYGELLDESTVRFERLLPGPIERAWSYLVDGDKRATWLCGGETALEAGGRVEMHFHNARLSGDDDIDPPEQHRDESGPVSFHGRVIRCAPPRHLSHTWDFDGERSEVSYDLEPVGDRVRLVLTHARLASTDEIVDVSAGWHTHLAILCALLNRDRPPAFWKTHAAAETYYKSRSFAG